MFRAGVVGLLGGIGDSPLAQFLTSVSADYIANCLQRGIDEKVFDPDGVVKHAKSEIIKQRRARDLSEEDAREQYSEIEDQPIEDDPMRQPDLMQKVFGDEWWYRLPKKPNPDYVYLCRIITAVQQALKQEELQESAA